MRHLAAERGGDPLAAVGHLGARGGLILLRQVAMGHGVAPMVISGSAAKARNSSHDMQSSCC